MFSIIIVIIIINIVIVIVIYVDVVIRSIETTLTADPIIATIAIATITINATDNISSAIIVLLLPP